MCILFMRVYIYIYTYIDIHTQTCNSLALAPKSALREHGLELLKGSVLGAFGF